MNKIRDTLIEAHRALNEAGVDHALIGGLALGYRGVHRATLDIDLLVDGEVSGIARKALEAHGFKLRLETKEVMHFTGIIPLDLLLANRAPTRKMLARAEEIKDIGVKCLQAEDIIGLKIQAYVNNPKRALQEKADILAIAQKNPSLDWDQVRQYADLFKEWPAIEALRRDL